MDATRLQALAKVGGIGDLVPSDLVTATGEDPVLATPFPAGEVAATALAAIGCAVSDLVGSPGPVRVDVTEAATSLLSFLYQQVTPAPGVELFRDVNPGFTALHRCRDDRWIHLHGGFPHLRDGTAGLLGIAPDAATEEIAAACTSHDAFALEDELAAAGLCGAVARTTDEWRTHPQGQAMAGAPAVSVRPHASAPGAGRDSLVGDTTRPLRGLRVLDCTRVLAGPTCGRTLAALGADVLRIGAPDLPTITAFEIDTGAGKRAASLDLDTDAGRAGFDELLAGADVVVWGFRHGSGSRHGIDPASLSARFPGLITVGLNAYGAHGPWAERRGWEQLAQTATGIALEQGDGNEPALIPAAATDYTTGYLAALGVLTALRSHAHSGAHVEASLAQTSQWLLASAPRVDPEAATGIPAAGVTARLVDDPGPFGQVRRLPFPLLVEGMDLGWQKPAEPVGNSSPEWLPR